MARDSEGPSPWARRLGVAGLIPFLGLTVVLWTTRSQQAPWASTALLGYAATIVSFLGAIHWGLLMRPGTAQPLPSLLWGVTPSLLAWVALMLSPAPGLALTAVVLWLCFAVDWLLYPRHQMQAWLPMRLWLTLTASGSCLVAALAVYR